MPTLSLGDLQNRVYTRLDSNTLLYTSTEVTNAINEAIAMLNLATGFLQASAHVPGWSVANKVWYDVPTPIVIPLRVSFENKALEKTSVSLIARSFSTWVKENTVTMQMAVTYWLPFGLTKFAIFPADAVGGGDIVVTGVQTPTPLVNLTDTVPFPNELLSPFDLYASHILPLKESPQIFAQTSEDYIRYQKILKQVSIWRGWTMPRYFIPEAFQAR